MKEILNSKSALRSTQGEQARQKEGVLYFPFVGLPCAEVAWNVLQIGEGFFTDYKNEIL